MEEFIGAVFQGKIEQKCFSLTHVKHISTASSLSIDQLMKIAAYLAAQQSSCTITVNDQIPLLLSEGEMKELQLDVQYILGQIQ